MPEVWNDILVVTKEELVPAYWTSDGLDKEIQRYKNKSYGIKRSQLGGNGRRLLIRFDSLARHIQDGLGDPTKLKHPLEKYYHVDLKAVAFFADFTFPDGSYILPETQEKYIVNASMAQALLSLKTARTTERLNKGGSVRGINSTLCHDAITFQELLRIRHDVQHNLPSNQRRFVESLNQFQKIGYISFVKDAHANGRNNARKMTPETIKLLNNMFVSQKDKPTATEVARQYEAFLTGYVEVVDNETGEFYNPKHFKNLSIASIRQYLHTWENKIGTHHKRNGDRQKLMNQFKTYHSLEQPQFAGSLISIDDRQPPFWYEKGKRVWFYNGIDLGSEAITCWVYGKTKEGIIKEFYQQLVRNYHQWGFKLPDGLECESSLNSSFVKTFLKEGAMFQNVRIEPNNARGKRIEAYFKPLRYGLEKKREGWIARPNPKSEANQAYDSKPNKIIPYEEIVKGCLIDIMTWNNTEHSKIKGKTRWEVFLENQNPELKSTNYKSFMQHLGKPTLSSCHTGIIKLQYGEYLLGENGKVALGEELIRLMRQVEGEDVDLYWLDDHEGQVFKAMIYRNGRYICEIVPKPVYNRAKIERGAEDEEARRIMSAYVATIEAFRRQQMQVLEPVTVLDNRPTTLNDKFKIPGLKIYKDESEEPVEVVPEYEQEQYPKNGESQGWRAAFNL